MPRPSTRPKEERRTGKLKPEQVAAISPHQLRYTIPQAALLLACSVPHIYVRARKGEIKLVKDGVRTYMTREEMHRLAGVPA